MVKRRRMVLAAAATVCSVIGFATATATAEQESSGAPAWQQGTRSLGNRVWHDINKNGLADAGEPGMADVAVALQRNFEPAGAPVERWVTVAVGPTDSKGYWGYERLSDGCYRLSVQEPAGYVVTIATSLNRRWFDYSNNDIDPVTGHSDEICLGPDSALDNSFRWDIGLHEATKFTQLAGGWDHSCGLTTERTVMCWGSNESGQLGNGTASPDPVPRPTPVQGLRNVTQVTAAYNFSCALLADGTAACWGGGDDGQLGNGSDEARYIPTPVTGLSGVVQLTSSLRFACAVLSDGTAKCWGSNGSGVHGNGTTIGSNIPTPVTGLDTISQIASSNNRTCAVLVDGTASCWGSIIAAVGTGDFDPLPAAVPGLSNITQIAIGDSQTCVVLSNGTTSCWGVQFENVPEPWPGLTDTKQLAGGCALIGDGTAKCWGGYIAGQLGDGTYDDSPYLAVPVLGLSNVAHIATGPYHACAALEDGAAYCWGLNSTGQLGNGTSGNRSSSPTRVLG